MSARRLLRQVALVATAVLVAAPRGTAQAPSADSAAVAGVVQRLFDALAAHDTVALRAILAPGARFTAVTVDTGPAVLRVQGDTAVLRSLAAGRSQLLERMWSPMVRVHGPIATLWAPYDFHIDGRRTHCGVDAVTLVRGLGGWRITDITYTVEPQGCADRPRGPPG